MRNNLFELQNTLRSNGILISFTGRFSQGIIEELGEAVKKHMESENRPQNNIFNVFAIFIEQTQNVKNYSSSKEKSPYYDRIANSGFTCIGKSEEGYFISSGNLIEECDIQTLIDKLELIKDMNKDELKKLYKELMRKEITPDMKSAGIGLVEIARKASFPIEYSIKEVDDLFSFFELKVIV